MDSIDNARFYPLNNFTKERPGDIFYWMTREQRLEDNPALNYARRWANRTDKGLVFIYILPRRRKGFAEKSYAFMVRGILKLMDQAREKGFALFIVDCDKPVEFFSEMEHRGLLGGLVCDFHPLRTYRQEREEAARILTVPVREVDGHNIVPCRYVSEKQEFAAYTLRKRIEPFLTRFLREIPPAPIPEKRESVGNEVLKSIKGVSVLDRAELERRIPPGTVCEYKPGYEAGMGRLYQFLKNDWDDYGRERNNPVKDVLSGLSPYLHFGQIAPQTAAFEAARLGGITSLKGGFLDEIIVRRELSDNFCWHNRHYDTSEGFPPWACLTLEKHKNDIRPYLYALDELEEGVTHDDLWNAAQHQMLNKGKMHGYMRMYWAKKILEWSPSAEEAMARAVYLNDKYSLDGEDPNGYAGCAWAIGGLHDRAWQERPVFGKIRYMNERGCRRKFPVEDYIRENLKNGKED